ncbi:hypothetical protein LEP1GSC021_2280 [Leptospira noguchii str. 1993005606]|nr:hypothetical protein LEP1GSC021_2280 [Leptospira noguchii str. 1993005606]
MSLVTCKKYVFLIEKNLPTPPHPKRGKTKAQRSLWIALWGGN